jgi:hypothetical protein
MSPSERLICRVMQEEVDEGYDAGTALVRVTNRLGVSRSSALRAWVKNTVAEYNLRKQ